MSARPPAAHAGVVPTGCTLAVTVLGSGGPTTSPHRAASSYLVWVEGQPRLLVDAGGGAFERLGRLGVDPAVIDTVLLTHTHIDHSGGLAPVVFAAWMAGRNRPITVVGPSGRDQHPGAQRFCDLLFGNAGAWSYLHTFDGFGYQVHEVRENTTTPQPVSAGEGLTITAVGLAHGMMPTLGYRLDHDGHSVTFSGDLEGRSEPLMALARGCDLLVHDQAMPRRDIEHGHLHPPPQDTAGNAAQAGVRTLLLTHFMPPGEQALPDIEAAVRAGFRGTVHVAEDLLTLAVGRPEPITASPDRRP